MVQLSPRKGPSRMQRKLPGGTESTCIVASSVLRRGQPDSGESCIVLQRGPTCSLVAKFPKRSSRRLQYVNFALPRKNAANEATDGCVRTFDA